MGGKTSEIPIPILIAGSNFFKENLNFTKKSRILRNICQDELI